VNVDIVGKAPVAGRGSVGAGLLQETEAHRLALHPGAMARSRFPTCMKGVMRMKFDKPAP
jgi:hypothetical protein